MEGFKNYQNKKWGISPPPSQPRDSPIVILVFFETFLYGYLLSIDLIYLIDIYYLQNIYISILCLLYIC